MGCYPSKRERIDIINGEILHAFIEMEIEDLKKLPKKRDMWEEISLDEEAKAKMQREANDG